MHRTTKSIGFGDANEKKNSATTNITVTLKAFEKWGKKENKQ